MTAATTNPNETMEIQRAREAEFLLNHPMIVGAFDALEASFESQWRNTNIEQRDEREEAFRMMHTVRLLKTLLTRYIETGKLAEQSKVTRLEQERLQEA